MPNVPETWRNQFNVNTTTAGSQFDPEMTQLANGNILVSWTTTDAGGLGSPNGNEVFGQIFDPLGNKIGAELRLNSASTGDDEQNSQIAALPGGGFVVVYHDVDNPFNGGASNIRLEEYDANGVAVNANALVVNDSTLPNDPDYQNPRVAVSSATSVLVVYEEVTAGVSAIRGKLYDTTTNTYGAQIGLIAFAGGDTNPDVTVLTNGNYVITANVGGADRSIGYRIINISGGNVLGATRITGTDTDTDNDREATVAALTGGGFVIVWTNTDLNDTDIKGRVYNAAGTETGTFLVGDTGATNNNNEPVVAGLADGSFVVVYDNDELNRLDVTHFSATGGNLGTFTIAATAATSPVVTDLGDGRFSVAWSDLTGEPSMEILDTRDNPNNPGVYTPDQWVVGTVGDDVFTADASGEIIHGWDGDDTITGGGGIDNLFGDADNDTINGLEGADSINGGDGDDRLIGGGGSDVLDGGADSDTADFSDKTQAVVATLDGAVAVNVTIGGVIEDSIRNIENLIGGSATDTLTGDDLANVLKGAGGIDVLNGLAGLDTADFSDKTLAVVATLNGAVAVNVTVGGVIEDSIRNIENLIGGSSTDTLTGDGLANVLNGGIDLVTDTLRGGLGNDTYIINTSSDLITEFVAGGTADAVKASVSFTLANDDYIETIQTTDAALTTAINLTGNALRQVITGNAGVNILNGGIDVVPDTLVGGLGNDTYIINTSSDLITEFVAGGAADVVQASVSFTLANDDYIDIMQTTNAALTTAINLTGNAIRQTITGNAGANILNGMFGNDILTGGLGADTFLFNTALGAANRDVITDFNIADDTIQLENTGIFTALGAALGVLDVTLFKNLTTGGAVDATDRILYDNVTGALSYDSDGNGLIAAIQFATLTGSPTVTNADFFVV